MENKRTWRTSFEGCTDAKQNTNDSAPSPHENRKEQTNTLKEHTHEWGCNKETSQHDTFTGHWGWSHSRNQRGSVHEMWSVV